MKRITTADMFLNHENRILNLSERVERLEALPNDSSPDLHKTPYAHPNTSNSRELESNPAKLPYSEELHHILAPIAMSTLSPNYFNALEQLESLITRAQVTTLKGLKLELRHIAAVRRVVDRRIQELNQENR